MKEIAVIISPNYKDYAKKYLADCIASIRQQDVLANLKIFLIDNESSQESFAYLQTVAPEAEIIRNLDNAGFARGNNVAIKEALRQDYKFIVLLNMDTIADPCAVGALVNTLKYSENIGAAQALLFLHPETDKINSAGNATHFLGFGYCNGYNQNISQINFTKVAQDIFYPSGAAMAISSDVLKKIGLFDEEFWMYAEDQDLGWRTWLAGYRCVLSTEAKVFHKYEFSRSIQKYYWMDRNRLLVILKNYRLATILLISPALIVMEFGLLYFSYGNKTLAQKFSVYRYFLKFSTWQYIFKARRETQLVRKINDRALLPLISSTISYQEIESTALSTANIGFALYWRLVRVLIFW